ncbi:hypothetical protein DOE78_00375 [Bacillus sp. Y1]|jgi:hypothetical protein|nr:hypothetical protein DOE78_00375 [Bacillus sp. Y1]
MKASRKTACLFVWISSFSIKMTIFIPLISTKTPFFLEGVFASEVMNIVPNAMKFIESCHVIE